MNDSIRSKRVTITPKMAKQYLAANISNRNLRAAVVERYAADMVAGRWHETGDGIRLSRTGRLLDGQHRLHAIVKAETPVTMFVFSNVPDEAQPAIDSGSKRTAADHLGMHMGVEHASTVAAATRLAIAMDRGDLKAAGAVSTGEIAAFVDRYPEIVDAARIATAAARAIDVAPGVLGYCVFAIRDIDPLGGEQFFTTMASGANLSASDPRLVLAKRFRDDRRARRSNGKEQIIKLVFAAWNHHVRGARISHLKVTDAGIPTLLFPRPAAVTS